MGVLPVWEVALLAKDERQLVGEARAADVIEVRGDLRVVRGHGGERTRREALTRLGRDVPVIADLLQHDRVVGGVADDRDAREVARRGGQERRAADVDHLDRLVEREKSAADLGRERADVDDHEVDRPDVLLDEAGHVGIDPTSRHDPGIDLCVERLDLAAHDRRHGGEVRDRRDLETVGLERLPRPVGGEDFHAQLEEPACKVADAAAVRDREQGSHPVSFPQGCTMARPTSGDGTGPAPLVAGWPHCYPRAR